MLWPEQLKGALELLAYGAAAASCGGLILVFALLWRLRRRERVGGELRVWTGTHQDGQKYCKYRLQLSKARKREIKIATGTGIDADFELQALNRNFAFLVRSTRDLHPNPKLGRLQGLIRGPEMLHELVCLPGTVVQVGDRLKSCEVLYDGDVFEIGGYVFQFQCAYIGKRPGGKEVLGSYKGLIGEPEAKSKGKKVLTLRLRK
jgi:hypothetical protein